MYVYIHNTQFGLSYKTMHPSPILIYRGVEIFEKS